MINSVDALLAAVSWQPVLEHWIISASTVNFHVDAAVCDRVRAEWKANASDIQYQIDFVDIYGGECTICVGALQGFWFSSPEIRRRARLQQKEVNKEEDYE